MCFADNAESPDPLKAVAYDLDKNVIMPGDRIAFPDRRGSHMWMNTARVLEILHATTGAVVGLKVQSTTHFFNGSKLLGERPSIVRRLDRVVLI